MTPEQREKKRASNKAYRERHPERCRASAKAYRARYPEKALAKDRKQKFARYNLTESMFLEMLAEQQGACAICRRTVDYVLGVDHNHACCPSAGESCGKCVRGLLCSVCNQMLGVANDDPNVFLRAAAYLEKHA